MSQKIYALISPDEVNIAISNYILEKNNIRINGTVVAQLMTINYGAQYRIEIALIEESALNEKVDKVLGD